MRSRLLWSLLMAAVVLSVGCLGGAPAGNESPTTAESASQSSTTATTTNSTIATAANSTITVENATTTPGNTTVVTVTATNVGELTVAAPADTPVLPGSENVSFSPRPDEIVDTYPPYWAWFSTQPEVTVEVPIHAAANATPGTYRQSITVWNGTNHSHENGVTETFAVVVENRTGRN